MAHAANRQAASADHYINWTLRGKHFDGNGPEILRDTHQRANGRPLWRGDNTPLDAATMLAPTDG